MPFFNNSSTVNTSAISGAAGTVLPANNSRKYLYVENLQNTGTLYVKLGTAASDISYNIALAPATAVGKGDGGFWESDIWRGDVSCSGSPISYLAWEMK